MVWLDGPEGERRRGGGGGRGGGLFIRHQTPWAVPLDPVSLLVIQFALAVTDLRG
jgi:hypothetical protein